MNNTSSKFVKIIKKSIKKIRVSTVSDLSDVSQRFLILNEHLRKLQTLFWTDPHHVPQQEDPVWSVANLHTDGLALEGGRKFQILTQPFTDDSKIYCLETCNNLFFYLTYL